MIACLGLGRLSSGDVERWETHWGQVLPHPSMLALPHLPLHVGPHCSVWVLKDFLGLGWRLSWDSHVLLILQARPRGLVTL